MFTPEALNNITSNLPIDNPFGQGVNPLGLRTDLEG
jgi:hypothetical protein